MTKRPYWELNGFTTEWYWHRNLMRTQVMDVAALARILARHPVDGPKELDMLVKSGNFSRLAEAARQIDPRLVGLPLFSPPISMGKERYPCFGCT